MLNQLLTNPTVRTLPCPTPISIPTQLLKQPVSAWTKLWKRSIKCSSYIFKILLIPSLLLQFPINVQFGLMQLWPFLTRQTLLSVSFLLLSFISSTLSWRSWPKYYIKLVAMWKWLLCIIEELLIKEFVTLAPFNPVVLIGSNMAKSSIPSVGLLLFVSNSQEVQ